MRFELQLLTDSLHSLLVSGKKYTEFELITCLKSPPFELFDKNALQDNLSLFQHHFVLFHCLYQLQVLWLNEEAGYLKISALEIQKKDVKTAQLEESADAKIRDYYQELDNLNDTSEQDVEALLDSFWEKFGTAKYWQKPSAADVQTAFRFFAIDEQASWRQVRKAYLRFQSDYHPDKGGETEKSQQASLYFEILKRHYKFSVCS